MALVLNCWEEANSAGAAATSLAVNKPTSSSSLGDSPKNVAVGDILVIIVGNDDSTATAQWDDSTLKPTGFTIINEAGDETRDCHCAAFYRIVNGTEGSSFTIPAGSSDDMWAACILVSNNEPSTPIHQTGADSVASTPSSSTPLSINQVTTTIKYCLGIAIAAYDGGDDGGFTVGGTGWGEKSEIRDGTAVGNASGVWATKAIAAAGASVACTVYPASSDGMVGFQFAIPPKANWTLAVASGKVDVEGEAATEYTVNIVEEYSSVGKVDIGGNAPRWAYKQYKNIFTHGFFENNYFDDELPTARQVFTAGWLPTEQAYSQSYAGSGLVTISGVAAFIVTKDFVQAPSGKVTISGVPTYTSTKDYTATVSGGVQVGGAVQTSELNDYVSTVSGRIEVSGVISIIVTYTYISTVTGKIDVGGISSFEFTRIYSKEAAGKVDLLGVVSTSYTADFVTTSFGTVVFSGIVQKEYSVIHSYAISGQVVFNGSSATLFERIFVTTCSGKIDISGVATTLTTIEYTASAVGKVQIGGVVLTLYTRSFTTLSVGKIDISGVVASLIGEKHFICSISGKVELEGIFGSLYIPIFVTEVSGSVSIGGVAVTIPTGVAGIYEAVGKIDLQGSSTCILFDAYYVASVLGEVTFSGYSETSYTIIKEYQAIGKIDIFGVASTSSISEFVCVGLGDINLNGVAETQYYKIFVVSSVGKIVLNGIAVSTSLYEATYSPSGKVDIKGSSSALIDTKHFVSICLGKVQINGNVASVLYSKDYVLSIVSGKVQFSGVSTYSRTIIKNYSSVGKVDLSGICVLSFTRVYPFSSSGKIDVFGSSEKTIEFSRSGIGRINLGGVVDLSCIKHFVYNVFGEIEVLGTSEVWISNQFEYLPSGELVFLGSPRLLCAVLSRMEIVEWDTQVTKVKNWKTRVLLEKEIDTPLYDMAYSR